MTSHEDIYTQARSAYQQQQYSTAIAYLAKLAHIPEYSIRAKANLGACFFHLSQFRVAERHLRRVLAADPEFLPARLNLANTLFTRGAYQEASRMFTMVANSDPANETAWQGLFECELAQQALETCQTILEAWGTQHPESAMQCRAQAILHRKQKNDTEALRILQRKVRTDGENPEIYALMSEILVDMKRLDEALAMIDNAMLLKPSDIHFLSTKANVHYFLSQVKECAETYERMRSLHPDSASFLLNQHLLFPIIPASTEEIESCRSQFESGLALAEGNPNLELVLQHSIALHTFTLAYHNRNDRLLLERYAQLMKKLASPLLQELARSRSSHNQASLLPQAGKIRIGFLSRYFSRHSNTMAFEGLIHHLDRSQFQVVLIHTSGTTTDAAHHELNTHADEVVYLSNAFSDIYNKLHDLNLSFLYFTDLGMTPFDFMYPFMRAAPIQLTGWGIPHTSGNQDVDYYISADGIEPAKAEQHYTETLVKLPGGLPCCFMADSDEIPPLPREYFFLPTHCSLIGCLQSLHKLHPDYDLLLEDIALKNPDSILVFVEDSVNKLTELYLQRLERTAPTARSQSFVLSYMGRGEYHALCRCMDLLLDPIYYGSGITFFEASLAGTPIVTLEGEFLRSRAVSAGYREMGLDDLPIAYSKEGYVNLTTDLIQNPARREKLRQEISEKKHRIFHRIDYVRNFEKFCFSLYKRL
jgi:protein O-GlcNAc transferase